MKYKSFIKIFLILITSYLLLVTSCSFISAYELLEPLPSDNYSIQDVGSGINSDTTFSEYLSWVFKFALAAAAFLAVLMITIGGIQLMVSGASESARGDAKRRIESALWGLLLALGSWLILYTINPDLAKMQLTVPDITIEVTPTPTPTLAEGTITDDQAKSQLNAAMVGYKPNVSFEGIRQTTIDEAKALSFDLQGKGVGTGDEQITSGTEGEHAEGTYSHANGYKFDLRMIDSLTNFIEHNLDYTRIEDRIEKDGTKTPQYRNPRGAIYAKEGDHWDVLVK